MKSPVILFLVCLCLQFAHAQTRDCDPVTLLGDSVSCMLGIAPADIVGFRYHNGNWQQIPIQIDERRELDMDAPYGNTVCGNNTYYEDRLWLATFYCDTATFIGADTTDFMFDSDDELSFMATDLGQKDSLLYCPDGVLESTRCEVAIFDSLDNMTLGYIYLFQQDGSLQQDAEVDYVNYDYDNFGGNFKQNYVICVSGQPSSNPNPELSTVTTDHYELQFTGRWINDLLASPQIRLAASIF
ncbi:MAG: hypothetical protein AAGI23_02965 [Bacteroidota bacterium]